MHSKVLLLIGPHDHTGTHVSSCIHFSHEFSNFGFETEILQIKNEEAVKSLYEKLNFENIALVHVEQGQLLNITVNGKNIFDTFSIPVCCQIRDHWFYPWLKDHLKGMPRKSYLIHCDGSHYGITGHLKGDHASGTHTAQYVGIKNPPTPVSGKKEKTSRPIFVGSCKDPDLLIQKATNEFPRRHALIERVVDESINQASVASLFWDANCLGLDGFEFDEYGFISAELYYRLFDISRVLVRDSFLRSILSCNVDIYIKGGWEPKTNYSANIILGGVTKYHAQSLMENSNVWLADQAAFKTAIGERVATAIFCGKIPLMRWNTKMDSEVWSKVPFISFDSHTHLEEVINGVEVNEWNMREKIIDTTYSIPSDVLPREYVMKVLKHYKLT